MLYVRKLFTQDLRDGKQIAFPKEPSYQFFSFDYLNNESDRRISFTFRANYEQFQEYDGKVIYTRLYASGSESRMDGEVKAFIRDELHAQVDDLLIFKNKGTKHTEFEVMFVPKSNSKYYPLLLTITDSENHTVLSFEKDLFDNELNFSLPHQQIFYGAPGTGKSHIIKNDEKVKLSDEKNLVFRTTFHPDSDYSTFVGCYKPAMKENIISKNGETTRDEQIVYRFVPQAFTRAYTAAWNTNKDVFLIIEEINRGNCAQIFGDLFQLLDRKGGVSEYPVEADSDMADYIRGELINSDRTDFPEGVKEGKKLILPSNLYIWATMNTSDQSLFPIDSAFKRRWDWRYMPIEDAGMGWKINVNEQEYDWYQFLQAINKEVLTLTGSEDKQLGYFFAKAKNGVIDADTLVNKVYFYLWTDVFKDCDYDSQKAFRKPNSNDPIAFKDFFEGREVNSEMAEQILINLGLYPIGAE